MPKLDINASFEGGGQNLEAGVTSTGEAGFVSFNGTDYEVAGPVWKQFTASYEQAGSKGSGQSLATLGIDPRKWLTNAENAGEAKVGDTDTIKITGDVDVPKLLDDVNAALAKLRTLGGSQRREPSRAADRRAEAAGGRRDQGPQRGDLHRRRGQDPAPDGRRDEARDAGRIVHRQAVGGRQARPPAARPQRGSGDQRAGEPEAVRGLWRRSSTRSASASVASAPARAAGLGSDSGSGSSATAENVQKYSECVQDAGGDTAKIQKCSDLLAAP